jgi:YVTN family beta-propeller protein
MLGGLLAGLLALGAYPRIVHTASMAPATKAHVGNFEFNAVSMIDPESDRVTHTIEVGDAPRKVAVQRTAASTTKGSAKVSIVNFTFTPAEITIAPGESVTWTNDDGAPHGLEYHDGEKGTDLLLPGASFSRQFDRPGTYDYNCSVHPYMTGRVLVRAQ